MNKCIQWFIIVIFSYCFCLNDTAAAQGVFTSGFQTLGLSLPQQQIRLDVAVWYPARRLTTQVQYGEWFFTAARNAPIVEGQHPLLLLSHDIGGSRFSVNALGAALARQGFIVAAPTHTGDNMDDMHALFSTAHIFQRVDDLKNLLDNLLAHTQIGKSVDPTQIGLIGIGPGAAAALLVAQGTLDASGWHSYCQRTTIYDSYCQPQTRAALDRMALDPNLQQTKNDPRVKAIALVAPSYGMFFTADSLTAVNVPTLVLRADLDRINLSPHHAQHIITALPQKPEYAVLAYTDNAALMSPCSKTLEQMLPELCTPQPPADRTSAQQQLAENLSRFMLNHLQGATDMPLATDMLLLKEQ